MARIIKTPSIVKAAGTKEKIIKEFIGNVNSSTKSVSIAMMKSPQGWEEPGQAPEFDEYTIVLGGELKVSTKEGDYIVKAGEAIIANKGEWIKYSSPSEEGAEYVAVCLPAFLPSTVHRDDE
jgi:ethanolamine utilization protein EutQ (cupin superfamily)